MSTLDVLSLYTSVLKLSTENKINQKNSWSLGLIDHMDNLCGAEGAATDFQRASATLEASTKIYSCRVDSVHTETYRVLGGLTRGKGRRDEDDRLAANHLPVFFFFFFFFFFFHLFRFYFHLSILLSSPTHPPFHYLYYYHIFFFAATEEQIATARTAVMAPAALHARARRGPRCSRRRPTRSRLTPRR
jgi:hypothetical protein